MGLLETLKSAGNIKGKTIAESSFFKPRDMVQTRVPIINVALTGSLDGGLPHGILSIAGPSRHFKSNLGLVLISAYMKKHPEAVCVFYDSEFGTTKEYLEAHGVDPNRMIHVPITNVEMLRNDFMSKLEAIDEKKDKVIFFVDSVGNLASLKEITDSLDDKNTADMTRAKVLKSMYRMITPLLNLKGIPCVVIQHTYETLELYSKQIMSGGTGGMLSSNIVWFIGRSQEKDSDKELVGYTFTINEEKSRFVKEKSKLPFLVRFDGGIDKYSGLLEIAQESKHVIKSKSGASNVYSRVDTKTGEVEEKQFKELETHNIDFWTPILKDKTFNEFIKNKYQLAVNPIEAEADSEEK